MRYAQMLADKMQQHQTAAWLVNTGWTGGGHGVGSRIKLAHTRAIIDAIHSGQLAASPTLAEPVFGLAIPTSCPGVPGDLLVPRNTWSKPSAYDRQALHLAKLFRSNFAQFADQATAEVQAAGPRISGAAELTSLATPGDKTTS